MTRLIQRVGQAVQSFVETVARRLGQQMELLWDWLGDVLGLCEEYEGLVFTEEEETAISRAAGVLTEFFPESLGKMLVQEDYESRCEAIEDFGKALVELYQMDGLQVVVTDDKNVLGAQEGIIRYGVNVSAEHRVYINAACLRCEDEKVLENSVLIVIHELRHEMQRQIATGDKRYGVPYARRHAWRVNMAHYIDSAQDFEGYFKQPIEFDARAFSNGVWRRAYLKQAQ